MDAQELTSLLAELISLPNETEWVEFKLNYSDPEKIGEYISALANSARLHRRDFGYIVWGINDKDHSVVGTKFHPANEKVKGQELENWLVFNLKPRIDFRVFEVIYKDKRVVIFQIPPCAQFPVRFKETGFIRIGSYKKKLRDFPEKEKALWIQSSQASFEKGICKKGVSSDQVLSLINYPSFFELLDQHLPPNKSSILDRLVAEKIIARKGDNKFDITNFGAILFAKRLSDFETLSRKAVRVIIYKGHNRTETIKELGGAQGYANGFKGLIKYINDQLPLNEQIEQALRKEVRMYPEIAIRELVANAIIHQDFSLAGNSPMIEIFSDRIEITNPGIPLIATDRFIDEPPQSRNETLTAFMRRLNICEERGSGIDKVIFNIELYQLPAPEFIAKENHTRSIIFAFKELSKMDKNDKIRACYQHACLRYVENEQLTNSSLRKRFGIEDKNYSMASRIISKTIDAGLIKPFDPNNSSLKNSKYVPYWV